MWWPTNQPTNLPTNNVKARDPVGSKNIYLPYYHFIRLLNLLAQNITQSHTIKKLKPMNNPSTPPQSATKEPNENASSSLWICMMLLSYIGIKVVLLDGILIGSSVN